MSSLNNPKDNRPDYHVWVFDPQKGRAYVDDHTKHNAAHFPLFTEMYERYGIQHPERQWGFVFPLHGGHRILDDNFKPLEDPFVVRQVRAALAGEDNIAELPKIPPHPIDDSSQ